MAVLTSAAPGTQLEQIKIADKVIEIAEQNSAVAQMAYFVKAKGQLKYVVDIAMNPAGIVAEFANVPTQDPTFKNVLFHQKRMASAIELSQDALINSAVDLNEHVNELLSFRILNGIEKQMFNAGDADGVAGLQNILLHNTGTTKIEDIETISNAGTANTYDDFAKAIAGLSKQPQMMVGAVWAIQDPEAIAAIKDPYGFSILNFKNVMPGSVGTILGIPAFVVAEGFSDAKVPAVLINPARSYTVTLADDAVVKKIAGDTTQALRQSQVFLGEIYVDGRVLNPRGVKIVKHA